MISNFNRPSSTRDNYSEQMHSAANSTGPGIVIKAILSSKLSLWWLKVFSIPISIKGHNLPFTYSQMSLKINLDKSNFGFCFYSQRGTQDTNCKRSSYMHYPTMCYLTWMQKELMWEWKAMEKAIQFAINKKINISILCILSASTEHCSLNYINEVLSIGIW